MKLVKKTVKIQHYQKQFNLKNCPLILQLLPLLCFLCSCQIDQKRTHHHQSPTAETLSASQANEKLIYNVAWIIKKSESSSWNPSGGAHRAKLKWDFFSSSRFFFCTHPRLTNQRVTAWGANRWTEGDSSFEKGWWFVTLVWRVKYTQFDSKMCPGSMCQVE